MLIFVIIILFVILFIPLPLKLTIHYSKEEYYIKFYNIDLFSTNDGLIKKFLNKRKNKSSKKEKKEKADDKALKDDDKSKKSNIFSNHDKFPIKMIYKALLKNKFKPSIKYNSKISYSLSDAAKTAIFYGLFNNTTPLLLSLFKILFKVKYFKNDFIPVFKDKIIIDLTISSIITFNLAQIIYMVFIVLKCLLKNKEVSLTREFYGK